MNYVGKEAPAMTETFTVQVPEEVAGDITIWIDTGEEAGHSDECMAFVRKLCEAKRQGKGKRIYREVQATEEELVAVVDEILDYVIERLDEELGQWYMRAEEKADFRRYRQKVVRFIERYLKDAKDE
jgi:hypothetical protein